MGVRGFGVQVLRDCEAYAILLCNIRFKHVQPRKHLGKYQTRLVFGVQDTVVSKNFTCEKISTYKGRLKLKFLNILETLIFGEFETPISPERRL